MDKSEPTKIVATISPITEKTTTMAELIRAGMNIARINMSWGTHEEDSRLIQNAREAGKSEGKDIRIILDLSGPRIQEDDGHRFSGTEGGSLTEKDYKDMEFGIAEGVEYFGLSYVGGPEDVVEARAFLEKNNSKALLVAKIERKQAVEKATEIMKVADGIMVARGDLGNEVALEQIPFVQYELVQKARAENKFVIVATEMMSSMINGDVPARADVTDVAFAVGSGADAVMLSNETAIGKYPLQTVKMMRKIVSEADGWKITVERS